MAHCVFFYAQARMRKFAANAACGPRGEWWRGTFPYSIIPLGYYVGGEVKGKKLTKEPKYIIVLNE